MTEKMPTSTYIFIDRRKTGRGKSIPNRQRLLRRIKDAIRKAKPTDIDAGGVKNMGGKATPTGNVNPVKVTRNSLHEPTFHYASKTGDHDIVLIGNDQWERGDEFPMSGDDEGGGGAGPGEETEDDFIVNISRDEYLNVFFEDCELPDLRDTHEKDLPTAVSKPAGFQKEGNPGQLSLIRSYKNAKPRRRILTRDAREELDECLDEYEKIISELGSQYLDREKEPELNARAEELKARIEVLRRKIASVPIFEKIDLRYRKREKVLVKSADAVFIMIMDISGSMDEDKKRMSRKFFSLQYAFIKRKYPQTDLVFIAHTDEAEEMTEEDFFSTRKSGGTIVSPAYALAHKIIRDRYDATESNIYLSQASDGDNWDYDNAEIIPALEDSGLLKKLRHMSYAQVGQSFAASYGGSSLWSVLTSVANSTDKLAMVTINDDSEVFEAFHQIYKKSDEEKSSN